jgi:hypothetical protein
MEYLHLQPGSAFPEIAHLQPFKTILLAEAAAGEDWQAACSAWLVGSGCRYCMAWGIDSNAWEDAVDFASLDAAHFAKVDDEQFVVTTAHQDESVEDVFWFAKHGAEHPALKLNNTLLLHIAPQPRPELVQEYAKA